jgi:hypothetical protein
MCYSQCSEWLESNFDSFITGRVNLKDVGNLQTFRHICIIFNPKTQEKKIAVLVGFEPGPSRFNFAITESDFLASKYFTGASVLDTTAIKTRNLKDRVFRARLFIMERHTRTRRQYEVNPYTPAPLTTRPLRLSASCCLCQHVPRPAVPRGLPLGKQGKSTQRTVNVATYLFMCVSLCGEILFYLDLVSCRSVSVKVYSFN